MPISCPPHPNPWSPSAPPEAGKPSPTRGEGTPFIYTAELWDILAYLYKMKESGLNDPDSFISLFPEFVITGSESPATFLISRSSVA
jgi:hypothetical protein